MAKSNANHVMPLVSIDTKMSINARECNTYSAVTVTHSIHSVHPMSTTISTAQALVQVATYVERSSTVKTNERTGITSSVMICWPRTNN